MNNNLVKSIAAGVLLGAALFIMPFFLIRLVVFFLIIGALFRLFGGRRFRRGGWGQGRGYGYMPAFADRIRQMSDEEYNQFKQRFEQGGRCGDYFNQKGTGNSTNDTSANV
ncbi:hypothetical protein [Spirosoma foliorum]|uniref:Uncharacterized protein n=1 Tax=Spirosoma foliorum TaxID=2710596 RepID=A0A7G5H5Z0_9BACT|nr:hypothetical protein [Spirosoma foliorum]QMW06532.1 hypothetical protein H3H32_17355 [Spirosoma foliorum]